jgi:6-phosphogluconate dehydrogenase
MPGGPESSWEIIQPVFEAISAKVDGVPCVNHIGNGGAGHFVKMVHNGIEYGDMQLICEAYEIFKRAGFSNEEMAEIFTKWNEGPLESFLIEITSKIFEEKDPETEQHLIDLILDKAGQKGTGRWTVMNAASNAVVISTINAAVEARILSSKKDERVAAAPVLNGPEAAIDVDKEELIQKVHDALYASKIISYAQGLDLIKVVSEKHEWGVNLGSTAQIWRGGCIIRARFLNDITDAFQRNPDLTNLMLDDFFTDILNRCEGAWREIVALGVMNGVPMPAFSASLGYYDSYRSPVLPANLIQAQRDFFGAHTYKRIDKSADQDFHTKWPELLN